MGSNRFATMLHRNTNKLTIILIYAGLEWTLIVLLLLNSLFSYLIAKFADYFGLKPPCPWCSRVDHFLEPQKKKISPRDLLCEAHAKEISKLSYCSNHQKLALSEDMCEDCSSSCPGVSKSLTFFPFAKQIGVINNDEGKRFEVGSKCTCCGVDKIYSPCIMINPSWDGLEFAQKGSSVTETGSDHGQHGDGSDRNGSDHFEAESGNHFLSDENGTFEVRLGDDCSDCSSKIRLKEPEVVMTLKEEKETIKEDNPNMIMGDPCSDDTVIELLPQHLDFFVDFCGHKLVPVELRASATEDNQNRSNFQEDNSPQLSQLGSESDVVQQVEAIVDSGCNSHQKTEEPKFSMFDSMEMKETGDSLVFHARECDLGQVSTTKVAHTSIQDIDNVEEIAAVEKENIFTDVIFRDVSIGTEIPDLNLTDNLQAVGTLSTDSCVHKDPSTSSDNLYIDDDHGSKQVQEMEVELKTLSVKVGDHKINNHLCNENEEEKFPDTPTSIESFLHLHKKLLLLERKESGAEGSLDGSVLSEFDGSDGILTVEKLTSALRAERKALHALYSELEEERSASAVAASQTMAMINRLQEEKAAMQMEALQYQRMMEEQSEYDQEALQMLNDLMVKREKENKELEKRVMEYESKEKMRMLRRSRDGSARSGYSSASCSNGEDSDGLSIDMNQELKAEVSLNGHQESGSRKNTPVDEVVNLEDSLSDLEEERISILQQLKGLEDKLSTLTDEEEQHFHLKEGSDFDSNAIGVVANGNERRNNLGSKAKSLLPLFDAMSEENEDGELEGHENGFHSFEFENSSASGLELDNQRVSMEEEVDRVYERLQALEADGEFVKQCMSSMKKGEKGTDILQEILQHLRDLKTVEFRVKNLGDCSLV